MPRGERGHILYILILCLIIGVLFNAGAVLAQNNASIFTVSTVPDGTDSEPEIMEISAQKYLDGVPSGLTFRFQLKSQDTGEILETKTNSDGLIHFTLNDFTSIQWLVGGVYNFDLYERIPEGDETFIYDNTVYTVQVRVYEAPYQNVIFYLNQDGEKIDEMVFENSYNHDRPPIDFFDISDTLPETGFSAAHATVLPEKPLDLNYDPLGWTLQIPSLSVMADIVTVPEEDGRYVVTWLGDSVGLPEGYALPGEGSTVITGHNHLNDMEVGPFAFLTDLEEGTRVFILDPYEELSIYAVYANEKIAEDDFSTLNRIAGEYDRSITFLTCEDERIEGGYANRRIVAVRPVW